MARVLQEERAERPLLPTDRSPWEIPAAHRLLWDEPCWMVKEWEEDDVHGVKQRYQLLGVIRQDAKAAFIRSLGPAVSFKEHMPLLFQASVEDRRGHIHIGSRATVAWCADKADRMRALGERGVDPYWYEPTDIGKELERLVHEDEQLWLHRSVSGQHFRKER